MKKSLPWARLLSYWQQCSYGKAGRPRRSRPKKRLRKRPQRRRRPMRLRMQPKLSIR